MRSLSPGFFALVAAFSTVCAQEESIFSPPSRFSDPLASAFSGSEGPGLPRYDYPPLHLQAQLQTEIPLNKGSDSAPNTLPESQSVNTSERITSGSHRPSTLIESHQDRILSPEIDPQISATKAALSHSSPQLDSTSGLLVSPRYISIICKSPNLASVQSLDSSMSALETSSCPSKQHETTLPIESARVSPITKIQSHSISSYLSSTKPSSLARHPVPAHRLEHHRSISALRASKQDASADENGNSATTPYLKEGSLRGSAFAVMIGIIALLTI